MLITRTQNDANSDAASKASLEALLARTVPSHTLHGRVTCRTTCSPATVQIPAGARPPLPYRVRKEWAMAWACWSSVRSC